MAESKRIAVSLPNALLKEIDNIICDESCNRSEFIRNATKFYIQEVKKTNIVERMKHGYMEMSEINITLAEIGLTADNETIIGYETRLAECE